MVTLPWADISSQASSSPGLTFLEVGNVPFRRFSSNANNCHEEFFAASPTIRVAALFLTNSLLFMPDSVEPPFVPLGGFPDAFHNGTNFRKAPAGSPVLLDWDFDQEK